MKRLVMSLMRVSAVLFCVVLCSSAGRVVKKVTIDEATTGWEKTLYFAMYKAECSSLSLESYRYLGAVKNDKKKAALFDEIFGEDEYMVVANYEENIFKIMTYGECINLTPAKNKDLYLPRKELVISQIGNRNIGVVELCWDYKGKKFKSKAIVESDGEQNFIYDNIMNYAPADNQPPSGRKTAHNMKGYVTEIYHNSHLKEYKGDGSPLTITYSRDGKVLKEEIHEFPRKEQAEAGVAKNTYIVNGKVIKEEVIEMPKMNHAEVGVAKTTYRVNGKVVKEEIEDLKTLTNQK
ncbi:MAG: hypothetical protein J6Q45_01420 [Alistipes sp.]|nr:hypothetical protein [Alistipes sp.]